MSDVRLQSDELLRVPNRRTLTYSWSETNGAAQLVIHCGLQDVAFDEPRSISFGEQLLRHAQFRAGDATSWVIGEPFGWDQTRGLLESLVAAGVLERATGRTAQRRAQERGEPRLERLRLVVDARSEEDADGESRLRSPFPLQRPAEYYPGLETRTIWDTSRFAWVEPLEAAFPAILEELNAVLRAKVGFRRVFDAETEAGAWAAYPLFLYGRKDAANCARCPTTTRLLEAIPGMGGLACFSAMAPRTRIAPHFGVMNARLRAHLGLKIPPACSMRVGRDRVSWKEGECLVFDDSFEHDVRNDSEETRFILMFDFPHPNLVDEEVDVIAEAEAHLSARFVERFESWASMVPDWVYAS